MRFNLGKLWLLMKLIGKAFSLSLFRSQPITTAASHLIMSTAS